MAKHVGHNTVAGRRVRQMDHLKPGRLLRVFLVLLLPRKRMPSGGGPGLQSRAGGNRIVPGGFDSHPFRLRRMIYVPGRCPHLPGVGGFETDPPYVLIGGAVA